MIDNTTVIGIDLSIGVWKEIINALYYVEHEFGDMWTEIRSIREFIEGAIRDE